MPCLTSWFSIPQACRPIQQLAIKSLPSLASSLHYFVVVAPETTHADTCVPCDIQTYHKRCWCRAEVMSHWSRRGTKNMFYATADGLNPMCTDGITKEFLEAVHVFDGDLTCCALGHHDGTTACDREELVFPMLGLYSEINARKAEPEMKVIYDTISPIINSIYPKDFIYKSPQTTASKSLFGDLVTAMERFIDAQDSNKAVNLAKLRAGTQKEIPSALKHSKNKGSFHGSASTSSTQVGAGMKLPSISRVGSEVGKDGAVTVVPNVSSTPESASAV